MVLALAEPGTAEHMAVGDRDGGNHLRIDANYTPPRDEFEQQLYRGSARTSSPECFELTLVIPCSIGTGRDRRKRAGLSLGTSHVAQRHSRRGSATSRRQKPFSMPSLGHAGWPSRLGHELWVAWSEYPSACCSCTQDGPLPAKMPFGARAS